ncbi:MAG: feruloyl-CoA synthase [Leptothrix sp. (in: b-proteobacteria)]
MTPPLHRAVHVGGQHGAVLDRGADGSLVLRAAEPLQPYPARLSDRLAHWAAVAPDRPFAAQRNAAGAWQPISYAQMLQRARAIGQALVDRGLSPERPVMILSGNDLQHLSLMMGAMWVGVPTVSLSPAYSLLSADFGRLRPIAAQATPGLVYAAHAGFDPAIRAVMGADVAVVCGDEAGDEADGVAAADHTRAGRPLTRFSALLGCVPGASGDAAHAATGPDSIVKLMVTSGSTAQPKGVIVTQRMWCANQQMVAQALPCLSEAPPVLVDWLPWSHTFGGNHNLGLTLYHGGSLYIDAGTPTPHGMAETVRNLIDISPTAYFNVPRGFDALCAAMERNAALRASLFRRVQVFEFGGAGLSQATRDALNAHAEATVGERIRLVNSLGMTEIAPSGTYSLEPDAPTGAVGLPLPGVAVKLVAVGDKTEARFRGPNVMPGYWREPALSQAAFDAEGYYRSGDAVRWLDPADPQRGLVHDGRLAEDFKLSTGTFVSVGPLRERVRAEGFPLVLDCVVAGLNRDDLTLLVFPHLDEARRLAGLAESHPTPALLQHPQVRAFFQALLDRLRAGATGSASRPARLHLLAEPPSLDRGELTDKGSINPRAVLAHRQALIEAIYRGAADDPHHFQPGDA